MIEFADDAQVLLPDALIKVIGVGGAGGNTVNAMVDQQQEIEFIVANTDAQALNQSKAQHKVQLGVKATKGLGTGANPELGKRAAQENLDVILDLVSDANIVFLTGGMGGGTGSGGLPIIAQALREKGILTIAIVTKPFMYEGKKRARVAQEAIESLIGCVDTLLIVPNQKLLELVDSSVSMIDAFAMINDVLHQSVKSIADIISKPGHINVDFADVNIIMKNRGLALMGSARVSGKDRAVEAAMQAISSPLLENMSIAGAQGVLINITGGANLTLHEVNQAASVIYEQVDEDANIIVGSVIDTALEDDIVLTVIATGFDHEQVAREVHATHAPVKHERSVLAVEKRGAILDRMLEEQQEEQEQDELSELSVAAQELQEDADLDLPERSLKKQCELLDVNDLDIPAFMRKREKNQD